LSSTNNTPSGFINAQLQQEEQLQNPQPPQPQEEEEEAEEQVERDERLARRAGRLLNPHSCLQRLVKVGVSLKDMQGPAEPWLHICNAVHKFIRLVAEFLQSPHSVDLQVSSLLDAFVFHAGRAFKASGYPLERATAFARLLAWVLDRDPNEVADIVVGAYDDGRARQLLEKYPNLTWYSGAREVIAHMLTFPKSYRDNDKALDASILIVAEVSRILGAPLDTKAIARRVEKSKYIVNDPLRGMLVLEARRTRKEGELEGEEGEGASTWTFNSKYVSDWYIDDLKAYINIVDPSEWTYEAVLKNSRDPNLRPITTPEAVDAEELAAILRKSAKSLSYSRLMDTVSGVISAFVSYRLAELRPRSPTTGFVWVKDKEEDRLIWLESPKFEVRLPPVDPSKAVEALKLLAEIVEFYKGAPGAVGTLYWCAQAPLGAVRKSLGLSNKILLNYGEPQTGKTTIAKICGYIWGMREEQSVIGASAITPAQLAERLSETTLPRFLDEVKASVFANDTLMEMLKTSTSGLHVKSRILPHRGYKVQEFLAYGSVAMTTNILPILPEGVPERLIAFQWTSDVRRTDEEYKRFAEKLVESKDLLAYIGSYLRKIFTERWAEVKEILKSPDQLEVGRRLLAMLYEELGLQAPEWLQHVEPEKDIQGADLADIVRNIIVEDINRRVKGNYEAEQCLTRVPCEERLLCLSGRLPEKAGLPQQSFLPPYIVLTERGYALYITPAFIYERLLGRGYNVSLNDLAEVLGGYTDPRRIGGRSVKVVVIEDRRSFARFLWPDCSAEEQAGPRG